MSTKQQAQTKVQKPEPARQTAVSQVAQLGPELLPAGLGQVEGLNGLPLHNSTRGLRQTAVLQMQRQQGNSSVQRYLARSRSRVNGQNHGADLLQPENGLGLKYSSGGLPHFLPMPPPPNGQSTSPSANGIHPIQRQEADGLQEEPDEEEKAAAVAEAQTDEAKAAQSASEAQQEVDKSHMAEAAAQQAGQVAKEAAEQTKETVEPPAITEEAGAEPTPEPESTVAETAVVSPAPSLNGQAAGYTAPKSPAEDPEFQGVVDQTKAVAAAEKKHAPAASKAAAAAAAAESPAAEIEGQAQGNQVGEMGQAETPGFNAAAFKAQLMQRITALAPKTAKEADEFKESNRLGGLQDDMQAATTAEQANAAGPLEAAAEEAPDTGGVEPKPVTPLQPEEAGPEPAPPTAEIATPKRRGESEVEAPLRQDSQGLDQQMAEADITEQQLADSNEPEFQAALASKKEAQADAQAAPVALRQEEQQQLEAAQAGAAATAEEQTSAMHADRAGILAQVGDQQQQGKSEDEQARAEVGAHIRSIYEETRSKVESILDGLDQEVSDIFTPGAEAAKTAFEDYVSARMSAYKKKRYGGLFGWAKRAKDEWFSMPSEVNVFYRQGRQLFIQKMDAVIDNIVALIDRQLTEAKAEIANGQQRIHTYVKQLPADLQAVGQEAAQGVQAQFNELTQRVDAKQGNLIDSLAQQYQENVQAVEARIEEMKAANRGRFTKAYDNIVGTTKTILELKDMLLGVLARVVAAVGKIIKNPVGFLGNLISGVKQGLNNFLSKIGSHLKDGLVGWLTGAMSDAGITLPKKFDSAGIFQLVLQVSGLSFGKIMGKVTEVLGFDVTAIYGQIMEVLNTYREQGMTGLAKLGLSKLIDPEKVESLKQVVELIQAVISGSFGKLWTIVQEHLTNLKEMVFGKIEEYIRERVIKAGIISVISLFNPAGAFIKACKMIYDIIMFFVQRGKQIMSLVNAVIDSVAAVASGNVSAAASFIEQSLAKAIPVTIGFLSSLLSLGNIGQKVKELVKAAHSTIDSALDKVFNSRAVQMVAGFIKKVIGKLKNLAKAGFEQVKSSLGFGEDQEEETEDSSLKAREVARIRVAEATQQPFNDQSELRTTIRQIESDLIPEGLKSLQVRPTEGQTRHFDIVARQEEDIGDATVEEGPDSNLPEGFQVGTLVSLQYGKTWRYAQVTTVTNEQVIFDYEKIASSRTHTLEEIRTGQGTIWKFKGQSASNATDEEKMALYDTILEHVGLPPIAGIENVDEYRQVMRWRVVSMCNSITELDYRILSSSIIPSVFNRIRGEIFEEWWQVNLGVSRPGPIFKIPDAVNDMRQRQADGSIFNFQSNILVDFKALSTVRGPSGKELQQMSDYGMIIRNGIESVNMPAGSPDPEKKTYDEIRYIFNKNGLPRLWYDSLVERVGLGNFSTFPHYSPDR